MLFFDRVIARQPGTLLGEYQAVVMNFTFAIELYLKTLWLIEETPHPKGRDGHNLRIDFRRSRSSSTGCRMLTARSSRDFAWVSSAVGKHQR